jgi:hypothetical protein
VKVTGVPVADPPVVELSASHVAYGLVVVSTVNDVPPVTADDTEMVCGLPYGVYVVPLRTQLTVIVPLGDTDRGDAAAAVTVSVTVITFAGPGALSRLIVVVWTPLAAVNVPHPAVGATVKVTGVLEVGVPPVVELSVIQEAGAFAEVVSTVNGVPAVAVDDTEIVCGLCGIYVLPFSEQVSAIVPVGDTERPDVVAERVEEIGKLTSLTPVPLDVATALK